MKKEIKDLLKNIILSGKKFVAGATLVALTIVGCASADKKDNANENRYNTPTNEEVEDDGCATKDNKNNVVVSKNNQICDMPYMTKGDCNEVDKNKLLKYLHDTMGTVYTDGEDQYKIILVRNESQASEINMPTDVCGAEPTHVVTFKDHPTKNVFVKQLKYYNCKNLFRVKLEIWASKTR